MEGEDVMEGEDDDEHAIAVVALTIDGECDITSYDWMKLCKMQNKAMNAARLVQADNFAKELPGHCLALEDRNSLAEEWPGRRVFVVRGATSACIFDEDGDAIDEPADFVSAGVQPLEDEDESKTFGHDWDAGFYRYNHEHKEKDEDDEEEEEDDDDVDEAGKKAGGDDGGGAEVDQQLPDIAAVGKRIKLCMGIPAKWYSGKVFEDHLKSNSVLIAFDDGDLHRFEYKFLAAELAIKALQAAVDSEQGVVANTTGYKAVAETLVYCKDNGQGVYTTGEKGRKPVGVMLGDTGHTMGTCKIYESFTVAPDAFKVAEPRAEAAGKRATRPKAGAAEPSSHDFHTFSRGDKVHYTYTKDCEGKDGMKPGERIEAAIFGVAIHESSRSQGDQSHKFLALYDPEARTFFPALWGRWSRVAKKAGGTTFDVDKDEHVQMIEGDLVLQMESDYIASLAFSAFKDPTAVKNKCQKLPTRLDADRVTVIKQRNMIKSAERSQAKKDEKKANRKAKAEQAKKEETTLDVGDEIEEGSPAQSPVPPPPSVCCAQASAGWLEVSN